MTFAHRLAVASFGGLLAAGAVPVQAQTCADAPGQPSAFRVYGDILKDAERGRSLLGDEGQQTGAGRNAIRTRRQALFRSLSRDTWRWLCDHQNYLSQNRLVRADVLIQGMVFFDLAGDVDHLRDWYTAAKAEVYALIQVHVEPKMYWSQPADAFLKIVRARGGVDQEVAQNWYFQIGRAS